MLRLRVTHGREERVFAIPEGEATLGSASENDIVLHVRGVSRRHALVRRCSGGVEILDRGSTNFLIVAGERVKRTVLTPGLRVQIGMAWLELQEVPSAEAALSLLVQSSEALDALPSLTPEVSPRSESKDLSPTDAALSLAYHVAAAGAGLPGGRADLLARIKATLGAEAFMTFERRRRGKLHVFEEEGAFLPQETGLLSSLAGEARPSFPGQVVLKQEGPLLLAGRDSWFLGARFAVESFAREGWRKDLIRFLACRLFLPVRSLEDFRASEARRVVALAGGNKKRAARLLGISRGTLYEILGRRSPAKR